MFPASVSINRNDSKSSSGGKKKDIPTLVEKEQKIRKELLRIKFLVEKLLRSRLLIF